MNARSCVPVAALGLVLAACSPGQILGPTVTPSPSPTPTSTPVPTATYTPTLRPTSTPIPATATATQLPPVALADVCSVPDGSYAHVVGYAYLRSMAGLIRGGGLLVSMTEEDQNTDSATAFVAILTGNAPNRMSGAPDLDAGEVHTLGETEQEAVSLWTRDGEELRGPGHRISVFGPVLQVPPDLCFIVAESIVATEPE
jgi:hypothetical protein